MTSRKDIQEWCRKNDIPYSQELGGFFLGTYPE